MSGKCPFDYVRDTEEWMDSGFFSETVRARLKGTSNYALGLKCIPLYLLSSFLYPFSIQLEACTRPGQVHITGCQNH